MTMLPTTGGWYCPKCGGTTPVGNVHHCGSAPGGSWTVQPVLQGWQCPVCGVVYAPTVPNCHNGHQPPPQITTGTCAGCAGTGRRFDQATHDEVMRRTGGNPAMGQATIACPDCQPSTVPDHLPDSDESRGHGSVR